MSVETVASVGGGGSYVADVFTDVFFDTFGQSGVAVTVAAVGEDA